MNVGRYEVVREIGRGGMGIVRQAYDPILERQVAIKTLIPPDNLGMESAKVVHERFLTEAKILARLRHPNVVGVFDIGMEGEYPYIVMEYLEGINLRQAMANGLGFDTFMEFAKILVPLADALEAVHRDGIVHRDLKPDNIFIEADGTVKLMDFGIARLPTSNLTGSGVALGTPHYISPEEYSSEQKVDKRADIYALAVIGFELFFKKRPFDGEFVRAILREVLFKDRDSLRSEMKGFPPKAQDILVRCMAIEPDDRYDGAREFVDKLFNALKGSSPPPAKPSPPTARKPEIGSGAEQARKNNSETEITDSWDMGNFKTPTSLFKSIKELLGDLKWKN